MLLVIPVEFGCGLVNQLIHIVKVQVVGAAQVPLHNFEEAGRFFHRFFFSGQFNLAVARGDIDLADFANEAQIGISGSKKLNPMI